MCHIIHISFDAESAYLTYAVPLCEQVQLSIAAPEENSVIRLSSRETKIFSSHASLHDASISVTSGEPSGLRGLRETFTSRKIRRDVGWFDVRGLRFL